MILLTNGGTKIIHVDMDAFYASVEQRDDPQLRRKPKQVKPGTCPKRCDVIRYPKGIMSRNWKRIVREMTSSPNAEAQLQIALESGLFVSATSGFGEVFEIKSSKFSPPPGDYVILFQDPVTCNIIARSHEIVEPKLP